MGDPAETAAGLNAKLWGLVVRSGRQLQIYSPILFSNGNDSVLVWSCLFIFVSGMVTYFWFGHLGLFWYGLEVVFVRSTFQINSKFAFGVVICDFPPLLVWSMDLTRTE
jgi:hypothetical protein